ncbi:2-aminoethylphosphonate-pyruvate transaminase [Aequitasia blattaphilus]|uniref:2-aminoethylphosphonate--pyruvate transaminase n=1 Tax=Aequitasia blattaphilus TaxID=2949332 RepID=A0ABT1E875_9FIRM|nr:2-aminoethylphosphonate--pyruvate transaminase [Aequitasia blattaphilus]MCP1101814.1 2-aminoethylphosphonate--pyruvate transaminase [Aequitasia blattaphilus]MCR8614454.1 2-aminoethylphosphonate--pyruvate transaminase [Aequitasia blattaphilus]
MNKYKLLTPGPLTTTDSVKEAMLIDHCTWDDDYKEITTEIRKKLLELAHVSEPEYTSVLMQGSGTFGVESVLTSVIGHGDKVLIIANGAYGERMEEIVIYGNISYTICLFDDDEMIDPNKINEILRADTAITHVAMVHCETTSGILNDIQSISKVAKRRGCTFIVDAMSSFGGIDIDVKELQIDFLISSANKCIQGVPGFSFVICKTNLLMDAKEKARSLSLDLYDQWKVQSRDGKWRFTSPTHVVLAFAQALKELEEEGGVKAREERYRRNQRLLVKNFEEIGFISYLGKERQSPIITSFIYPRNAAFSFQEMYDFIKERGYAIYPGKVTKADTFRIGNIGEIYEEDIIKLTGIMSEYMDKTKERESA